MSCYEPCYFFNHSTSINSWSLIFLNIFYTSSVHFLWYVQLDRIKHTYILDDPFDDPPQLAENIPEKSPEGKPQDEVIYILG